ncbi:uroporphyrin-III C-methyltransferase / precorrin-2 dehydrogenase / sirohydrochlorin ferrochelatase/precorrin-2 dehydrogenase / sirohydrochlorin ferrochelatase [Marinococcus luteus]|uniref:precorrin-2 dehydrogenase n=1 Tax=Marinococcus luteus TaxID=1122204 RepID=A0A1H2X8L5_9BACI|nr:NAD(P)-dependent oxidoreductase [Marinococcus luteus]SDW88609.1 uroporphyrin-III C-methyltransferase / precorrin-2 dehydrogenase / sirohydrochlorin ferrochelatase/precorrin-2 dehydrogenase / sirohydrochlorin ferrochelatase [Marinococcus luteus]
MSDFLFPLAVNLDRAEVVIIGGGSVAERKAGKLLEANAAVTIVAPELSGGLKKLWEENKVGWKQKEGEPEDLKNAWLIISASGDKAAQQMIAGHKHPWQLVNGADNPSIGNVAFPASFKEDGVQISVSSGSNKPASVKEWKHYLQRLVKKQ